MNDPVSDLLNRLKNSARARQKSVDIPASRLKVSIIRIFKDEGYIKNYRILKDNKQGVLRVYLKYAPDTRECAFSELKRVSKCGRRIYHGREELPRPASGLGTAIVSTSRGLLTDRECRSENVGGEVLLEVW